MADWAVQRLPTLSPDLQIVTKQRRIANSAKRRKHLIGRGRARHPKQEDDARNDEKSGDNAPGDHEFERDTVLPQKRVLDQSVKLPLFFT